MTKPWLLRNAWCAGCGLYWATHEFTHRQDCTATPARRQQHREAFTSTNGPIIDNHE